MITDPLQKKSYDADSAAIPFRSIPRKSRSSRGCLTSRVPSSLTAMPPVWSPTPRMETAAPEGRHTKRIRPSLRLGRERGSL